MAQARHTGRMDTKRWACGLLVAIMMFAGTGATAAAAAAEEPEIPGRDCVASEYVVQRGDWLWKIARTLNPPVSNRSDLAARVRLLYKNNQARIGPNPNRLRPGMVLMTGVCL